MESGLQISLPVKPGAKKIRKRRELDALVSYSIVKRGNTNKSGASKGNKSLNKLIRTSTDDQEECELVYKFETKNCDRDVPSVSILQERNYQKLEKCRVRKYFSIRMLIPLIVFIILILLFGLVHWLYFDLRQQFIEYRRKIEEVSVISQNLPEEMQKWHEKSTLLEKNQSIIYEKLNEIQLALEGLKINFTKFAAQADLQKEYSKDDKFVADLGAKLEAVAGDMVDVKKHVTTIQDNCSRLQDDIDKLGARYSEISNHIPEKKKDEDACLEKIQSVQTNFENDIKSLAANVSVVNDTLTQKAHILNEELLAHKTKLDDLLDKSANITSHVTSIKNDWTKYRQQIVDCEAKVENFENNMSQVLNKTSNFEKSLQEVRLNCTSNYEAAQNKKNSLPDIILQTAKAENQTEHSVTNA